jgi:hypothetical protein
VGIRTVIKAVALLAACGTAFLFALAIYNQYRYSNVKTIAVTKLSDVDEVFEVGSSGLRVRDPEFLIVCFAADYVHALEHARKWLAPNEAAFARALEAAGGLADTFNDEGGSSIVLLSHTSAVILELRRRTGFSVAMVGCASADNTVEIRKSRSDPGIEFWLPNATLRSTRGT